MTAFLDLFSGIGGFALGAYWAGLRFDKHYFSEVDDYAIQVYQKRFPEAELLGDIRNVDYRKLPKGEWFVTGGFPCQPHSVAGKKQASKDERDLWPECSRMLRKLRPRMALFENVPGLFISDGGRFFNRVLCDIHKSGYDAEWQVISAADVGAPHLRKRVWIVAYSNRAWELQSERSKQEFRKRIGNGSKTMAYTDIKGLEGRDSGGLQECLGQFITGQGSSHNSDTEGSRRDGKQTKKSREHQKQKSQGQIRGLCGTGSGHAEWWRSEPAVGRVANGIPFRVDRLKGLGNAVVPQCVEMILSFPAFDYWRVA